MLSTSRDLRDTVVRGLAKVGLVWAVAALGFMFSATAALGNRAGGGYTMASSGTAQPTSFSFVNAGEAPRTAGLVLALAVLGVGLLVLVLGSLRADQPATGVAGPGGYPARAAAQGSAAYGGADGSEDHDLPLALGLGMAGSSAG